ncbi:hypothetical protein N7493_002401 [Penicillium malachiteum]|uniref:Uncharacterized protein n=1 Tax=Penicillium malachiteum TaxID=1324776 RepID=A0AAD6MYY3_9EURO|nr:hypothetical protein N7493_002401 [Penicillium malachiteum]
MAIPSVGARESQMPPADSQGPTRYGSVENHGVTLGNISGDRHEIIVHMHTHGLVDSSLPSLVNELRAFLRRGRNQGSDTASIASVMTNYDDDDKLVWREFRRDLIKLGFSSSDIRKHAPDLKTHLHNLRNDIDENIEEWVPQIMLKALPA